jgi:hypothetical protein
MRRPIYTVAVQAMLLLSILSGCKKSTQAQLPIPTSTTISRDTFLSYSPKQQSDYLNSLQSTARMDFLSSILPGTTFEIPPDAAIHLLPNGDFIYDTDSRKRDIGHWKIEGQKLFFSKEKNDQFIDFMSDSEELTNPTATNNPAATEGQDYLSLEFNVNNTTNTFSMLLLYQDEDRRDDAMKFYNETKAKK